MPFSELSTCSMHVILMFSPSLLAVCASRCSLPLSVCSVWIAGDGCNRNQNKQYRKPPLQSVTETSGVCSGDQGATRCSLLAVFYPCPVCNPCASWCSLPLTCLNRVLLGAVCNPFPVCSENFPVRSTRILFAQNSLGVLGPFPLLEVCSV